jgi:hypothetical protein
LGSGQLFQSHTAGLLIDLSLNIFPFTNSYLDFSW